MLIHALPIGLLNLATPKQFYRVRFPSPEQVRGALQPHGLGVSCTVIASLNHCKPESVSLEPPRESQQLLARAMDSLGDKTPQTKRHITGSIPPLESTGSLMVAGLAKGVSRPRVQAVVEAGTGATHLRLRCNKIQGVPFPEGVTELLEDKKLFAKTAADEAAAEKALVDLEREFAARLPRFPGEARTLVDQADGQPWRSWVGFMSANSRSTVSSPTEARIQGTDRRIERRNGPTRHEYGMLVHHDHDRPA